MQTDSENGVSLVQRHGHWLGEGQGIHPGRASSQCSRLACGAGKACAGSGPGHEPQTEPWGHISTSVCEQPRQAQTRHRPKSQWLWHVTGTHGTLMREGLDDAQDDVPLVPGQTLQHPHMLLQGQNCVHPADTPATREGLSDTPALPPPDLGLPWGQLSDSLALSFLMLRSHPDPKTPEAPVLSEAIVNSELPRPAGRLPASTAFKPTRRRIS